MQKIIEKFLWSGMTTLLNASCWTYLSMKILELKIDYIFVLFSGIVAWVFYTKDRLNFNQEDLLNNKERVLWYQKYMKTPYLLIIGLGICILLMRYQIIPLILIGILLAHFYTATIKISNKVLKIKRVFLGKVLFIPPLWLLLTVYIPISYIDFEVSKIILTKISLYIFIIIGIQVIIHDIDDVVGDKTENIKSVPVLLGLKRTKIILGLLILSSVVVGWSLFNVVNLIVYSIFICCLVLSYGRFFSYGLKFLNASLGYLTFTLTINF